MSGNDEKTGWIFLWKQIYDRYLHIQPTNRPNGCFVVIFKVFYDIHKSSLNKKNDEEEETSEMLGSGLKTYDILVVKNV